MNGTVTLNKEFCQIPSAVVPICLLSCKRRAVHSFIHHSSFVILKFADKLVQNFSLEHIYIFKFTVPW